jgi:hypothetical protein
MIKPILIENLIPITYQNDLEKTLNTIPFYFTPSIGYNEDSPKTDGIKFLDNIGFSHSLIMNNKIDSDYWNLFKPILYFFNEKTGIFVKEVLRVRLRLTVQHPDREQFLFNKPHTDLPDFKNPYKTLIVYLNESDGDTFIFNKFYNEGHQYHSGNTPINYKARYLINFDFTI